MENSNTPLKELENSLNVAKSSQEAKYFKKLWDQKYLLPLTQQTKQSKNLKDLDLIKKITFLSKESSSLLRQFIKKITEENIEKQLASKFFFRSTSKEIIKSDLSISNQYLDHYFFNPLNEIKSIFINFFNNMNFSIQSGDEIVTFKENFENLNIPKDHPSRSPTETFFLDKEFLLRPHCTVNSVKFLKEAEFKNRAAKCVTIGKVYRNDDGTSRHVHQFNQLDFVWVDKHLNVGNLKWLLITICKLLFGDKKEYRFRNSYFPFTHISYEIDVVCNCSKDKHCSICKGTGWIEILGAGMLKRNILDDCKFFSEYQGLAGGLGLERIAMIKYGISDIRKIYENNFEFLSHDC